MAVFGVCLRSGTGSHPQPPSSSSLEEQSLEVPLAPRGQVWQAVGAFPSRRPSAFLLPTSLCLALQMMVFRCRARVVLQAPWWPRGRDPVLDDPLPGVHGTGGCRNRGEGRPCNTWHCSRVHTETKMTGWLLIAIAPPKLISPTRFGQKPMWARASCCGEWIWG